ncbi:hypothetical protein HOC67_00265 [Candidatus Peregrinibacteria bacterium]|nr:hypothetical protein [Candidatus Peregrinibacteria bacterium]
MKKYYLILSFGLLLVSNSAHANQPTVYQKLRDREIERFSVQTVEPVIAKFVPRIFPEHGLDISESDVLPALAGLQTEVCRAEINEGEDVSIHSCDTNLKTITNLVQKQSWLRGKIRDFQVSAASYEMNMAMYGVSNSSTKIPLRLLSISNIWESGFGTIGSTSMEVPVRGEEYPNGISSEFDSVRNVLEELRNQDEDLFIAAVWRYLNGYRRLPTPCENNAQGDGTPWQMVSARFCELEQALNNVFLRLPQTYDPPISSRESVLFPSITLGSLGVHLWARNDDIGLEWDMPINPILPALDCSSERSYNQPSETCEGDATLGGNYPPELPDPQINSGICSHPIAKRGYLCRTQYKPNCPDVLSSGTRQLGGEILLTECSSPQTDSPVRITESGPNVCGEGGWRTDALPLPPDTQDKDIVSDLDSCSNCYTDLVCDSCSPEYVSSKEEDGRIEICIDTGNGAFSTYSAMHGLIRAQQMCDSPAGTGSIKHNLYQTRDGCCAMETSANMLVCNALAGDGVLDAIGLTIPSCATALANIQCENSLGSSIDICGSTGIPFSDEEIFEGIKSYVNTNSSNLMIPSSCSGAVLNLDGRNTRIKQSLPQICSPECSVAYPSTIGNAACHIGQCIEQSLEDHRLIPGRVTWATQDQAFPWDAESNGREWEQRNVFAPPDYSVLPSYAPERLVQEVDSIFCQTMGLPLRSLPTLCSFDSRRSLSLPANGQGMFAAGFTKDYEESKEPMEILRSLVSSIGARVGSEIYTQYFRGTVGSLVSIMQNTNSLISSLEEIDFPKEMCPRLN